MIASVNNIHLFKNFITLSYLAKQFLERHKTAMKMIYSVFHYLFLLQMQFHNFL